jgi:hypothetical protein
MLYRAFRVFSRAIAASAIASRPPRQASPNAVWAVLAARSASARDGACGPRLASISSSVACRRVEPSEPEGSGFARTRDIRSAVPWWESGPQGGSLRSSAVSRSLKASPSQDTETLHPAGDGDAVAVTKRAGSGWRPRRAPYGYRLDLGSADDSGSRDWLLQKKLSLWPRWHRLSESRSAPAVERAKRPAALTGGGPLCRASGPDPVTERPGRYHPGRQTSQSAHVGPLASPPTSRGSAASRSVQLCRPRCSRCGP